MTERRSVASNVKVIGPNGVAIGWLDEAAKAARKARRDPDDAEALHRFRVHARRLVSYLKSVGRATGAKPKRRRRLRRLLRATGSRRDAQIEARWLEGYLRERAQDEGAAALARELARRGEEPPPARRFWKEADAALAKLRRELSRPASPLELRAAAGDAARDAWARLERRLGALDAADARALHKTRIAVKRLRALVEALAAALPGLPPLKTLRRLQTVLGEVHDREVVAARVAEAGRGRRRRAAARAALAQLEREKRTLLAGISGTAARRRPASRRRAL